MFKLIILLKLPFLEETIINFKCSQHEFDNLVKAPFPRRDDHLFKYHSKKESFDQVDNLVKAPFPTTENNSIQALDVFAVRVNDMLKLRVLWLSGKTTTFKKNRKIKKNVIKRTTWRQGHHLRLDSQCLMCRALSSRSLLSASWSCKHSVILWNRRHAAITKQIIARMTMREK